MAERQLKPSDCIRELFSELGWTCQLHPSATEDDWRVWLEHFEPPLRLGHCPECGARMVERDGRYGAFAGCSEYPACRFTCEIEEARVDVPDVTEAEVNAHQRRFAELQARAWRHFEASE